MRVYITQEAANTIKGEAKKNQHIEVCGFLIGKQDENTTTIHRALPSYNSTGSNAAFVITPDNTFRAMRAARNLSLRIVGLFHSHPRGYGANPSIVDLSEMARFPTLVSIIYGDENLRAFQMKNGRPVKLHMEAIKQKDLNSKRYK